MKATTLSPTISLGDRYSQLTVVVITLAALLLGWGLKTGVQGRTADFSAEEITARVPAGWRNTASEGQLLRAANPLDPTTVYGIETLPASEADLANAATTLSLRRAQNLLAYRVLEQTPVTVGDRSGYKVSYVYVDSEPTLTMDHLPVVMRGADYFFDAGGRVVVVTLMAAKDGFDQELPAFWRFLSSISY